MPGTRSRRKPRRPRKQLCRRSLLRLRSLSNARIGPGAFGAFNKWALLPNTSMGFVLDTDATSHSFDNRPSHRKLRGRTSGSLCRYSLAQKQYRFTITWISRLMHGDGAPITASQAHAPATTKMPTELSWARRSPCCRTAPDNKGLRAWSPRPPSRPQEAIPDAEPSVHPHLFPFQARGSRGRETGGEELNRTWPRRHLHYRKSGGGYSGCTTSILLVAGVWLKQ